jgi:hypothetical protein
LAANPEKGHELAYAVSVYAATYAITYVAIFAASYTTIHAVYFSSSSATIEFLLSTVL